jgi:hypothetical protein
MRDYAYMFIRNGPMEPHIWIIGQPKFYTYIVKTLFRNWIHRKLHAKNNDTFGTCVNFFHLGIGGEAIVINFFSKKKGFSI